MRFLRYTITLILITTTLIGDYVVFKSKYSESIVFRAISDSLVHGSIGFISAILFFYYETGFSTQVVVLNVIYCTILSSLIDIDHVFLAKSLNFKELINLKHRGIFHCTSLGLAISTTLIIYSYVAKKLNIYLLSYMITLAYVSHHLRDANRRGIWLYPFGSTPALHKYLYMMLIGVIPHVLGTIFLYTKSGFNRSHVNNDDFIV